MEEMYKYSITTIFFLFIIVFTQAQEGKIPEVVYDTVYTYDTIVRKKEVLLVEKKQYVLDLMIGVTANYASGISTFEVDSFFSPVRASAFTFGVPFRANFKPWFFSSTLNVTFLNTETDLSYRYNREYYEPITLYDTLDVYKIVIGNDTLRRYTVQEKDSSILVYKTEGDTITSKNRYTFLSLPLMTGLQFDAKHFSFAISAGVVVSCLVTNNKNNQVASENSFVRESQLLLRRFYLEPAVDVEIFIPFSENFDVSLGLVYRYSNKSIYKQQNYIPLNQSFAPKVSFFLHF